jgi:ElaB/YqjD/DUF883 family membrane-anchored ribosome-binding protein
MAERIVGASSVIAQQGMSERNRAAMNEGGERSVVAEFMDAARSSAESLLEEQKRQIADRVHGFAEALEGAARSLHVSQNRMIARYVQDAGDQVRSLAHGLHGRRWNELVAETEDFVRRQPTLFVLGAVAAGFLVGRLLWTTVNAPSREGGVTRDSREAAREVTAAVSSAPGSAGHINETAGHAAGSSGTMESR